MTKCKLEKLGGMFKPLINLSFSILIYLVISSMQGPQNLLFTPTPSTPYKIVSVLDQKKALSLQDGSQKIMLNDYFGSPSQIFKILQNNHKYAFVNTNCDAAIRIENENKNDGGLVKVDPGNFQSSFIQIVPVTKGEWAGKACHLMTFANGMALDIKGAKAVPNSEICQSKFSGNNNQQWLILPADNVQKIPPPPPNTVIQPAKLPEAKPSQPEVKPAQPNNPMSKQEVKPAQPNSGPSKPEVKVQVPEKVFENVAEKVQTKTGYSYKILSLVDDQKCLTVGNDKKLHLNTYKNQISQKFNVYPDKSGKMALVACSNNSGLCIFKDDKTSNAQVVTDSDKKESSWVTVVRADKGKYASKGYLIKTFVGNKTFEVMGGALDEGKNIVQNDITQNEAQIWLFEIFEDPKNLKLDKKESKKESQKQSKPASSPPAKQSAQSAKSQPIQPQKVPPTPDTKGKFSWGGELDKTPQGLVTPTPGGNQGMGFIQFAQFKPNQHYAFYPVHGNMKSSLDVAADRHVVMNAFSGQPNQRFVFELEGNMYRIKSVKENKYLNLVTDDQKDGIALRVDDKGPAKSQLWMVLPASDAKYAGKGAYNLRTIFGKSVEAPGNKLDNNLKVQQAQFNAVDGQTWVIKQI